MANLIPKFGRTLRALVYGIMSAIATLLVIGLPTDVIPNPWFIRMIPTRTQDYIFLGVLTILAGALGATFAVPTSCAVQEGKWAGSGILSFLAVGCPICNKVVIALLGTSGALTYFQPVQPILGVLSIALLAVGLIIRARAINLSGRLHLHLS